MKDQHDNSAEELFETPKKRGRPATGKARTAAQRQAKYRRNKTFSNKDNLNVWIDAIRKIKLEKLAEHNGLSLEAMLEKLIYDADYD